VRTVGRAFPSGLARPFFFQLRKCGRAPKQTGKGEPASARARFFAAAASAWGTDDDATTMSSPPAPRPRFIIEVEDTAGLWPRVEKVRVSAVLRAPRLAINPFTAAAALFNASLSSQNAQPLLSHRTSRPCPRCATLS
jgi:hypothetical protein